MGVLDGQKVNQAITNPAFINKNVDDTMPNKLGFVRPLSGADIADIQKAVNNIYAATGVSESTTGTAYNATPSTIANGDDYQEALYKLAEKFHPATGHTHTGAAGDAPEVSAGYIGSVPLLGYLQLGTSLSVTSGATLDVSTQLSGKSVSTGSSVVGVCSTSPSNMVRLRSSSGYDILDSSGNTVYGRLSYLSSVWTLSFYSFIDGVETAYSFAGAVTLNWWYQELFNPLGTPPVYNMGVQIEAGNLGVIAIGAINFNEDGPAVPVKESEGREPVFLYPSASGNILYFGFKVPTSYKTGRQITFKATVYSPSTSGTILLSSTSYLVRKNTDAITSTTNSHASTNVALTNTVANQAREVDLDLTDSVGKINSVAVSVGDYLIVGLLRGTDTDTADLRLVPRLTEVTFQ